MWRRQKDVSEMVLALEKLHAIETAKLHMQIIRYRLLLEENGITPPDDHGEDLLEMWRSCRNVIRAAHECVAQLGTSKEMLSEAWR